MPEAPLLYETQLYETHAHTPLCGHASGEPGDYAAAAARRGLKGVVITCHNPMPDGYSARTRMAAEQFDDYQARVAKARTDFAGEVDVRLGLECDYLPEFEPWLREQVASAPLNYVLGSVHAPYAEYRSRFWTGDLATFQRGYFGHLAQAAETGLFDCLAHPDLVKIVEPERWDVEACLPWIEDCLDRVAATGVAIEHNTSGRRKAPFEFYPGDAFLRGATLRGIPIVLGADAHQPERVGADFEEALDRLAGFGAQQVSVFLERSRVDLPIAAARVGLRPLDG